MSDLGPEAKNLLADAMDGDGGDGLASRDKARLRGQLLSRIAVAGAAGAGASLAAKSATAKAAGAIGAGVGASAAPPVLTTAVVGSSLLPKIVGAVLVVGTLAGGAVAVRRPGTPSMPPAENVQIAPKRVQTAPTPTVLAPAPAEPVVAAAASVAEAPSAPVVRPIAARPPAPTPTPIAAPAPTPSASTLEAETRLLRGAQAALQSGDGARALAILDQHALAFPSGALAEERSAQRVFALCSLGRTETARAEAAVFLSAHPSSPLAGRVRTSCGRP